MLGPWHSPLFQSLERYFKITFQGSLKLELHNRLRESPLEFFLKNEGNKAHCWGLVDPFPWQQKERPQFPEGDKLHHYELWYKSTMVIINTVWSHCIVHRSLYAKAIYFTTKLLVCCPHLSIVLRGWHQPSFFFLSPVVFVPLTTTVVGHFVVCSQQTEALLSVHFLILLTLRLG